MILYPAIDISEGKAVRLVKGDFNQVTVYEDSPLEAARAWVEAGARFLHVVDLAAALVPGAFGRADAAEVEAHAGPAELEAGTRDRLHDLVVERAAELGMGMAEHHRGAARATRTIWDGPFGLQTDAVGGVEGQ